MLHATKYMVSICFYPINLVIVQIYNNIETKIAHYFIWFCMNQSYNIWHGQGQQRDMTRGVYINNFFSVSISMYLFIMATR